MFDLNKKVRYENLAVSLQRKLENANKSLDELAKKLNDILDEINKLLKQISSQANAIDSLSNSVDSKFGDIKNKADSINIETNKHDFSNEGTLPAILNGFYGQFAKINKDKKSIIAHDGFEELKICTNQAEFDRMTKIKQIDLEEVFNTWYRYAHFHSPAIRPLDKSNRSGVTGQNLNRSEFTVFTDRSKGAWAYDKRTKDIICTVDLNPVAGFIIPYDGPTSWMMKIRIDTDWDDDNFGIVVGYMKDSNGVEHTLTVTRAAGISNGGRDTMYTWGLIYDMGNPTQFFLNNLTEVVGFADTSNVQIVYITVIKNYDQLDCRTTKFSPRGNNEITEEYSPWSFKFSIPDEKPDYWSQTMYSNIKTMLRETSRIGFMVRSDQGKFRIIKQKYIFDDDKIYRLDTNQVFDYNIDSSSWKPIGKVNNYLTPHIFIYNKVINRFAYYSGGKDEFSPGDNNACDYMIL
nr:MAG TPA: putative virion structural protein [Caudoviricetes sp.]